MKLLDLVKSTKMSTSLIFLILIFITTAAESAVVVPANDMELQQSTSIVNGKQLMNNKKVVIANDLLEQPEVAFDSPSSAAEAVNDQQPRKQQKPQKLSAYTFGGHNNNDNNIINQMVGVINGNRATYVEPPVDFKPIIYDYERQQAVNGQLWPTKPNQSGESFAAQPSQLSQAFSSPSIDPMIISSSSYDNYQYDIQRPAQAQDALAEQQQQQQQRPEVAINKKETTTIDVASGGDQFKPSIGRWNDWHDMSIEPDLASSENQLYSQKSAFQPFNLANNNNNNNNNNKVLGQSEVKQRLNVQLRRKHVPPAISRTRNNSIKSASPSLAAAAPFGMPAIKTSSQVALGQQQLKPQVVEQAANVVAVSVKRPQQEQQTQIKGGQHVMVAGTFNALPMQELPLNSMSMQKQYNKISSSSKVDDEASQLKGLSGVVDGGVKQQQQPLISNIPAQRRIKRRRKSKSNAEVRIQQLVADSQMKQDMKKQRYRLAPAKQVNGLVAEEAASNQQHLDYQVKPQREVSNVITNTIELDQSSTPTLTANNKQDFSQANNTNNDNNLATADQQQQVVSDSRVPKNILLSQQQSASPTAAVVIKRFGGYKKPLNNSTNQQSSAAVAVNSNNQTATNSNNNNNNKRVISRRRIKTTLPVGLSSWFLGGIRDLDGRHWQLPSEVINRLAINDVDLVDRQPLSKQVDPPSAGSVILISSDQPALSSSQSNTHQHNAVNSFVEKQDQAQSNSNNNNNKVPISQLIPR